MKKIHVIFLSPHSKNSREFTFPTWFSKFVYVAFLALSGATSYFIADYLTLSSIREKYEALKTENAGIRGEAKYLMTNLEKVKKSLFRVQDYTNKLSEITRLKVEKVSKHTGIGPLTEEEYSRVIKQPTGAFDTRKPHLPFGLNIEKLVFNPTFQQLNEVSQVADTQAQKLRRLLSTLSKRRSLLSSTPSVSPVDGWITSGFGKRISPFTEELTMHKGIDIAAPIGSPILAPADGVVIYSGKKAGFGNFIMIAHNYGVVSRYGHNAQNMVHPGQRIKRGEQIGTVGMTGRTTGPHLHYEVLVNGKAVNPRKFILDFNL